MNLVKFTEIAFSSNNKKGILKPDEYGYYTVILGALNAYNSVGEYYTSEGVLELFQSSSLLMKCIKDGNLYSELGHPKKEPGMTLEQFYSRVMTIDERNICGHISEITLDFEYGKKHPELNNPDLIAIIGKVKPAGPHAEVLRQSLENPKENTSFSIRGLTENKFINGKVVRRLTYIRTFDFVWAPGIEIAKKSFSPTLEDITSGKNTELLDTVVNTQTLKSTLEKSLPKVSLENDRLAFMDLIKKLDATTKESKLLTW